MLNKLAVWVVWASGWVNSSWVAKGSVKMVSYWSWVSGAAEGIVGARSWGDAGWVSRLSENSDGESQDLQIKRRLLMKNLKVNYILVLKLDKLSKYLQGRQRFAWTFWLEFLGNDPGNKMWIWEMFIQLHKLCLSYQLLEYADLKPCPRYL